MPRCDAHCQSIAAAEIVFEKDDTAALCLVRRGSV